MLPKAVLSFVGRLVGIAAVLVSPLASAAEKSDAPAVAPSARPSPARVHRHNALEKKAKKRGSRHADPVKTSNPPAHCDDPAVTTERASAKTPPKQSATPLPTLAAAATKPLAEPVAAKTPARQATLESRGHGVEPRSTPIIRASLHTTDADAPLLARREKKGEKHAKPVCLSAPVNVTRGTEEETFPLTKCDGSVLPHAVDEMSILVRPGNAAKPAAIADAQAKTGASHADKRDKSERAEKSDELAPGIKKIDERLVERLQLMIDHFAKPAPSDADASRATPKIFVVSGYRPASKGSFHAMGRAIDFRMDGVENTDLVAFCKTLPDTGCGFYPNSSFIHLDVRDAGAGHVAWIDASAPGEKPEYVAAWPPPPPKEDEDPVKLLARLDELQILPPADHDAPKTEPAKSGKAAEKCAEEPAAVLPRKLEDQ